MSDAAPAWVEACVAMARERGLSDFHALDAKALLSVLTPLIERETAERCARLVEQMAVDVRGDGTWVLDRDPSAEVIAFAIRAAFPAEG